MLQNFAEKEKNEKVYLGLGRGAPVGGVGDVYIEYKNMLFLLTYANSMVYLMIIVHRETCRVWMFF